MHKQLMFYISKHVSERAISLTHQDTEYDWETKVMSGCVNHQPSIGKPGPVFYECLVDLVLQKKQGQYISVH